MIVRTRVLGLLGAALLGAALLGAALLGAPSAAADNVCIGVFNRGGCTPAPWNGQQMDTWNIPGYYGGWTNGPVLCDPFTTKCRGVAQP